MSGQPCYLEHANLTVRNVEESIRFLTAAFPEFRVRGRGESDGLPWAHVGTDEVYVAVSQTRRPLSQRSPYDDPGINHMGFVVPDVDGIAERLQTAGFAEGTLVNPHPHRKRIYYVDADNNEWEFVQYMSTVASERNEYAADS